MQSVACGSHSGECVCARYAAATPALAAQVLVAKISGCEPAIHAYVSDAECMCVKSSVVIDMHVTCIVLYCLACLSQDVLHMHTSMLMQAHARKTLKCKMTKVITGSMRTDYADTCRLKNTR